jgi:hypothetical protein
MLPQIRGSPVQLFDSKPLNWLMTGAMSAIGSAEWRARAKELLNRQAVAAGRVSRNVAEESTTKENCGG